MEKLPKEVEKFARDSAAKVNASHMFLSLVTPHYVDDPYCMLQIGAAMLLDKPLLFMVERGTKLPENLRKVAADIAYFDAGDQKSLEAATQKMCDKGTALAEAAEKFKAQNP